MARESRWVRVEGLDDLQYALRELPDATAKNVLRRVARKVLQPIADAAAAKAPVRSGALVGSIIVSPRLSRRQRSKFQPVDPNDVVMFVGPGALPQSHHMEFGTVEVTPRPYLRPAWGAGKQQVLESIKEELWTEIEKAAKRLAKKAAKAANAGFY